ncbi:MAG: hypothetical protein U1F43_07100 [Myxococcota bacterium]
MRYLILLAPVALSLAAACGDSPAKTVAATSCVRDAALIDARAECRSDDLCPCGTRCELGQCTASCRADGDCGAGTCDDFGQCRAAGSVDRIAPLAATPEARSAIVVSPSVIHVADGDTPYFVTLRPSNGKAGPARVVARGGVDLVCEAGAEPSQECNFAEVPVEGTEISVRYRALRAVRQSEQAIVEVYDAAGNARSILGVPVSSAPAPIEGTYLGQAWLESPDDAPELEAVRSQTEVLVFERGGATTLSIRDELGGALDETVVLEATHAADGALTATLPTRIAYAGTTHDGTSAEVVIASTAAGAGRLGAGHVELVFPVRIDGLDLDGTGIAYRLVVTADRTGELPTGSTPPTPTADATPTEDLLRGQVEPALYAAARTLAEAGDPFINPGDRAPFDQSLGTTPAACFAADSFVTAARDGTRKDALTTAEACAVVDASAADFQARSPRYLGTVQTRDCSAIEEADGVGVVCAVTGAFPVILSTFTYDGCAAMAAALGCVPMPSPARVAYHISNSDDVHTDVMASTMCWFDTARFSVPTTAQCLGATACFEADASLAVPAEFTEFLSEVSGDPGCRDATTFGALEVADQEPATILAQCSEDLARAVPQASGLDAAFGSAGCVDAGRWRLRLEAATRGTVAGQHDPAVEGMASHLVQQWLQLHALVARLGANQLREELVLAASGDPTGDAVLALETSLGVWSDVLQPSVAGALLATSASALRDPDPRPLLGFDATDAVATARIGVSVDLLETAAEQAELLDLLLSRAWFEGNEARLHARQLTAARVLRVSALAGALAERLHRRANEAGASSWETAWQRAVPRHQLAVERLTRRLELILSGANPIGIEDTDLPLYYRGAPVAPEDRFAATSRFLAGDGSGPSAVAPAAIERARVALDAARARWAERRSVRDVGDRRIQDIKFRYGELVTGYCGASIENDSNYAGPGQAPCINPGSQSLFDCDEIDTEYCFVEEACRPRPQAFTEELTSADLGYSLCVAAGLDAQYGASLVGLSRDLDTLLVKIGPAMATARADKAAFPIRITAFTTPSPNVRLATIAFASEQRDVPLDALGKLDVRIPEAALRSGLASTGTSPYRQLLSACEVSRQKTLQLRPATNAATCAKADDCKRDFACREARCAPLVRTDPLDTVDCYYDGAISEQAIAVRGAANDIEIATAEFDEFSQRYDLAKRSCLLQKAGADQLEAETAKHDEIMTRLDGCRTALAAIEAASAGAKDCANTISGAGAGAITGAPAVACGFAVAEVAAKIGGAFLEEQMGEAERDHDATMLRLQNQTDLSVCLNDAELELVGARAATLRVLRAQQARPSPPSTCAARSRTPWASSTRATPRWRWRRRASSARCRASSR